MRKWFTALAMAVFILGGWSQASPAVGGEDLFRKVDQVRQSVQDGKWNDAKQKAKVLEKVYNKKRWKIMFLGDESEYEGVDISLKRLQWAIDAKDKPNAQVELAEIHATLQNIYSF
jgi:hypothetical protein